ncbi:C39 family peptidase [Microcoleus sp. FACHB-1515]|uniref:cysteine peptidase family C39 domain-containing protein n=1 Tax=Cyanophyceae TaxID=3028117 RepID=UPI001689B47D|nr:cysteine peptidase family C39 domain-containing protein [Microcoleus sp. FACHB-1515]MBD2088591.1 C39 family peptidase [Microcoleus sp. FACHB-1515]
MSAADLIARIDAARGDHQRASDLLAEARDRYEPPEPPPPPPDEGIDISAIAHTALDFAGFIPGVGVVADLANAALYAAEGNYAMAGLSAAAAVPLVGDAAAAAKLAAKGANAAMDVARVGDMAGDAARVGDASSAFRRGGLEFRNPASTSLTRSGDRPVFDQGSAPTCGPVSAAMVLATSNRHVDINRLAQQAGTTQRGTQMKDLKSAMNANGANVRLEQRLSVDGLAQRTAQGNPAIAHMKLDRGDHAVVVDGVTERQGVRVVAIRDPAGGRQYFTPADEFAQRFTGRAIVSR